MLKAWFDKKVEKELLKRFGEGVKILGKLEKRIAALEEHLKKEENPSGKKK